MIEPQTSQRFPALYRAVAKMQYGQRAAQSQSAAMPEEVDSSLNERRAAADRRTSAERRSQPDLRVNPDRRTQPDRRTPSRPTLTASPIAWVAPAPSGSSPESRNLRMARARAERELAYERQRMVETVDKARQAQHQFDINRFQRIEAAMQQRVKDQRAASPHMESR